MNKRQLATRLARQSHRSRGQAADEVDTLVYSILKDLRAAEFQMPKDETPAVAPKDPEKDKAEKGKR